MKGCPAEADDQEGNPSAACERLQPGQPVAAAGAAEGNRNVVVDQLAATVGEDRWTAGEACPLPPAFAGGKPSDEAAVWEYGATHRDAAAASGVAEELGK
jgi:hypothetical protein